MTLLRSRLELTSAPAEVTESRSFRFVCSTSVADRNGRMVAQDWNLAEYAANPIVLWNHALQGDGWSLDSPDLDITLPIGFGSDVAVVDGRLEATITFVDAAANPLAERVYQGVRQGSIRAVSVGWTAEDITWVDEIGTYVLTGNRLLEISLVSIPANPEATRIAFLASLSAMKTKGKSTMLNRATLARALRLSAAATDEEVLSKAEEVGKKLDTIDMNVDEIRTQLGLANEVIEETGESTAEAAKAAIRGLRLKATAYDTLTREVATARVQELVRVGLREGKLTPANRAALLVEVCGGTMKDGSVDLETVDPARLEALLRNLPPLTARASGEAAGSAQSGVLSERDAAIVKARGWDPQVFLATKHKLMTTRPAREEDDE